jgi:CheY-like chemotaxis protein
MPTMDGLTATRHIRELEPPLRNVPILALTANVYAEQIATFMKAGMNGHIGKPFKREELLAAVDPWSTEAGAETAPPEPAPKASVLDTAVYDELHALIGNERMSAMLEKLEEKLARLRPDGGDAVIERQRLARDAHSMISTAGMLGFMELSDLCRVLEDACLGGGDVGPAAKEVQRAGQRVLARIETLKAAA